MSYTRRVRFSENDVLPVIHLAEGKTNGQWSERKHCIRYALFHSIIAGIDGRNPTEFETLYSNASRGKVIIRKHD
jgi:hypothetical protein